MQNYVTTYNWISENVRAARCILCCLQQSRKVWHTVSERRNTLLSLTFWNSHRTANMISCKINLLKIVSLFSILKCIFTGTLRCFMSMEFLNTSGVFCVNRWWLKFILSLLCSLLTMIWKVVWTQPLSGGVASGFVAFVCLLARL